MSEDFYTRFDNIFFEKTRLSLMTVLYQEERAAFNTLKRRLNASDGAAYTHIEKLIKAGYVKKSRGLAGDSVQTVYSLTEEGKRLFRQYLEYMRQMLSSLDEPHGGDEE